MQDAKPGFQDRFRESMGLFAHARHIQASHREKQAVASLEEYIDIRRDSSGMKPLIDILEYTLQIDLPDKIINHPKMISLKECVNDFCTWSNVRQPRFMFLFCHCPLTCCVFSGHIFLQQGTSM